MDLIARTWDDYTRQPPSDAQALLTMMVQITSCSPLSQGARLQELREEMARFYVQEDQA